jgi:hypothetical protein
MSPVAAFIAGVVVTFIISVIVLGRLITVWYDKHKEAEATIFELRQQVIDLENKKSPTFQVGIGGADPVVVRNRPVPAPLRESVTPPGEVIKIIDDLEDIEWSE